MANGQSRQLTTGGDFQPVWSPDGRRIAFLRSDGQSNELHIVNVATGDERRIEMGNLVPGLIAWGPER